MARQMANSWYKVALLSVACIVGVSAAVKSSQSRFWTNLNLGKEQKLVIYGTSLCIEGQVKWPSTLKRTLENKTGGTVNLVNKALDGSYSKQGRQSLQSRVIDQKPDAVTIEFASNDAVNRFDCTVSGCAEPNLRYMIETIRDKLPSCEIFLYVTARPWDKHSCGNTPCKVCGVMEAHYCRRSERASSNVPVEKYFEMVRKLAAEYETYCVDTYWDTKEIWDNNRSSYGQWVYDGHHTTQLCADKIIIPRFVEAMQGTGGSPPLTIEEPTEGASYRVGDDMTIRWTYNPDSVTRVLNINISPDNGVSYLTVGNESIPPEQETFQWTIPGDIGGIALHSNTVFLQIQEYNTHREAIAGPFSIVGPDTVPPKLTSIFAQSATSVKVVFNEPVTRASAENTGNYAISDGIGVSGASLGGDNTSVMLTVSTLTLKKTYTLTVSNITDRAATPNTGGDQKQFSYSGEVGISNLTVASGASYEIVKGIAEGDKQYIDRGYTFNSLGEYAGMTYIRTANDDKEATDEDFLTFDLSAPATLFVPYRHGSDLPPWLSSWTKSGNEVCGDGCSDVYEKDFDAGTVTLGANKPGGAGNMYSVFVDAGGDPTIFASKSILRAGAASHVRALVSGTMLQVSGLYPHNSYMITLTDARGRIASVRTAAGHDGIASISTSHKPRGVYIVDVCEMERTHRRSLTIVLP